MELLKRFAPFAIVITLIYCALYIVLLQQYRQGLDDPQVQVSQDIALRLEKGGEARQYIPPQEHDLERSYATFVALYSDQQSLIGSSGAIEGVVLAPSHEVFALVKDKGVHRFSWEPKKHVRIAAVMRYVSATTSTYVLVGRNMREGEGRMRAMGILVLSFWLITMGAALIALGLRRESA